MYIYSHNFSVTHKIEQIMVLRSKLLLFEINWDLENSQSHNLFSLKMYFSNKLCINVIMYKYLHS